MRLLVGYDGSDGGRDALELARVMGEATGASVLLVTVLPYGPLPIPYEILDEEEAERAQPLFEEAEQRLGNLEVETRAFGGGSAAGVINDLAEREEVDTIVVGSPHRGPVGRTLIGSVADGLLHGAPCEVIVAPRGYAEEEHGPFRTIAVAYDGTDEAEAALKRAEAIALECRATIVVFTVSAPPTVIPGATGYTPAVPPEAGSIVTGTVRAVDERLAATGRALAGVPGPAIVAACEEAGADLLVSGSRHYGPMLRVLLGSVSTQLAHKAACPVLMVPRPAKRLEEENDGQRRSHHQVA
ncbi:MAG TPA: universal stress protein [Solirubrobacterales bacterium]|nr:universal stress protein [Solirubrobacterales bacterium]